MKFLIASDLHGSASACRALMDAFEREKADKLLLLGDILYHGPRNNLPNAYDTKEALNILNAYFEHILCVRGNCDAEVDQCVLRFPILAEYAVVCADGLTLYMQHGHREAVAPRQGEIVLRGHTHIPAKSLVSSVMHLNPGSVAIPKGGSAASYMVYEDCIFTWKTLEGAVFDEYRALPGQVL